MKSSYHSKSISSCFALVGMCAAWAFTVPIAVAQPEPVLHFDGVESIIRTGLTAEDLGIHGSASRTVEAWVFTRSFNDAAIWHLGARNNNEDFALRTRGGVDQWRFNGWFADVDFDLPGSLNNWVHFAVTYNGSTLTVFADGVEVASDNIVLDTSNLIDFRIGRHFTDHFDGKIRDVRVWTTVRSQEQIQENMNASPAGQSNLAAWWPMNEGEGRTIFDESGNAVDAPIFAAQWEAQQFEYKPEVEADFTFDFGIGDGKSSELILLRNRGDHYSLREDSIQMTSESENFISSSASASVANRGLTQNFVLETDIVLTQFPDERNSTAGLVALGGPHVPLEAPFNAASDENYYAMSFAPGLSSLVRFPGIEPVEDGTPVIYISEGFSGPVLAASRWEGRKPLPNINLFENDFEDSAGDDEWQTGGDQNSWEIGTPTVGPERDEGTRVAATVLDGNPPTHSNDWLRSPVIDLEGVGSAVLTYWEALSIDGGSPFGSDEPFHSVSVRILNEAGDTTLAELDTYTGNSGGWRQQGFLLPEEALGQRIRVEFFLDTDEFVESNHFGWMIDDLVVESLTGDLGVYAMKAEGTYGLSGELNLTFTMTDMADDEGFSQSISATIANPLTGNMFGIGGSMQAAAAGNPQVDFKNLSMSLGDAQLLTPTTRPSAFSYTFGENPGFVAPDAFALLPEENWILQQDSLQASVESGSGNNLVATSRMSAFRDNNPIEIEAKIVLSSLDLAAGGQVGLVLFGEEDPTVFDPDDSSSYYSFQYSFDEGGAGNIFFREGMDGPILEEASFDAPIQGATYKFEFSGSYNGEGILEFVASLTDGNGGDATLSGALAGVLESHKRFGMGVVRGGGDIWDFLSFAGNTRGGADRFLVFDGSGTNIDTGLAPVDLGIEGSNAKTIEAWVYARTFDVGGVFQIGAQGMEGQNLGLGALGDVDEWQVYVGAEEPLLLTIPGSHNTWTHIALVYDGTEIAAYANGDLMWTEPIALDTQPGVALRIGQRQNAFFNGSIRDFRVWDHARSESEIQSMMNGSPAGESGLTGWWPLNEGLESVAYDSSGNTRNAEIESGEWSGVSGSVTIQGPDVPANFVDFNGDTSVVNTGTSAGELGVDGANPRTIEVWVLARENEQHSVLRMGVRSTNQDFTLVTQPGDDNWRLNGWSQDTDFTIPGSANNWTHIAITTDGTTGLIYGNGELVATTDSPPNATESDAEVRIGGGWRDDREFNGSIRDVRIWDVVRTEEQIRAGMHISPVGTPGLVAWWPLDEGDGEIANDRSGNGWDGTIVDGTWDSTLVPTPFRESVVVRNDTPVTLTWDATFANNVRFGVAPDLDEVSGAGMMEDLVAATDQDTVYTLEFSDSTSSESSIAWIRSVPVDGFEALRYVRFQLPDSSALRDSDEDSVQLSGVSFFRNGQRVEPVGVTNPGGDNPAGNEVDNLVDGSPLTKWRDLNKAVSGSEVVFDFGTVVEIDSYRFETASDAPGRDPLRWILSGRDDDSDWRNIENMDREFSVPARRSAETSIIPLAGVEAAEPTTFEDWLDLHFVGEHRTDPEVSDPGATPAGDGIANLLKYAFGLDPWTSVGSSDPSLPQMEVEGETLRLTYLERIGAQGIAYQPEGSFGLSSWTDDGIQEVTPRIPAENGDFEWVTVELDITGETKAFLRVVVSLTQ